MANENISPEERAEREAISSAIADTEQEIFNAGVGSEDLEKDGDKSLEEMDDPLGEPPEQEASEDDDGEADEPEAEVEAEGETEPQRDERDVRTVPSGRLREETEARQRAEREMAEWRARYDELARSARPQQPPQQPPPEPDMFADPDAWKQDFRQRTVTEIRQEFARASVAEARAKYGDEFEYAFRLIDSDPRLANEAREVLASINPGETIMRIAEPYLAEFREQRQQQRWEQLQEEAARNGYRLVPDGAGRPSDNRPQQQRRTIPPSLNGASGSGGTRQRLDPRGMDGSEAAIFADAFTPLR